MDSGWSALWGSFRRSWVHATSMQLATLATLAAAYGVVVFALTLSLNLKRVLAAWGDSVQVTAYLREDVDDAKTPSRVQRALEALPEAGLVEFISKERATELFHSQLATYAPDLLDDKDFAHPFPASFRVKLKAESKASIEPAALDALVATVQKIEGIEDVSYGQSWIRNYAALVRAASAGGWALAAVLAAGALFVIGNSIRASIAQRREEIEILELVGATPSMIRAPYVFEGAAMGFSASIIALAANFAIWNWESRIVRASFEVSRLIESFSFLPAIWIAAVLAGGLSLGAVGAYPSCARSTMDGPPAKGSTRDSRAAGRRLGLRDRVGPAPRRRSAGRPAGGSSECRRASRRGAGCPGASDRPGPQAGG